MARLIDGFRSTSPQRQLGMVAGAFVLLVLTIAALWYLFLRSDYQTVFTDLQPADAAIVVAELEKQKTPYKLAANGTQVLVPAEQADAVRVRIMGSDLPFRGTVGFELFAKSDMGMTDFAQRINYQRALQGELARTIMAIDGVESARVHLALGEAKVFRADRIPPKASIMVRMRAGARVPSSTASGIRRMVAAAVDQLDPANVILVDERGIELASGMNFAAELPARSPSQQALDAMYEARVREAIAPVVSGDDVEVMVDAGGAESTTADPQETTQADVQRTFSVRVTLVPHQELAPSVAAELQRRAEQAIDFRAERGDQVTITVSHPLGDAAGDLAAASRPTGNGYPPMISRQASGTGTAWMLYGAFFGTIVILVAGMLAWQRRRRQKSAQYDQSAFAARLNELLLEDEQAQRFGSA